MKISAICSDGMCPYIPCKEFPKCKHIEEQLDYENKKDSGIK